MGLKTVAHWMLDQVPINRKGSKGIVGNLWTLIVYMIVNTARRNVQQIKATSMRRRDRLELTLRVTRLTSSTTWLEDDSYRQILIIDTHNNEYHHNIDSFHPFRPFTTLRSTRPKPNLMPASRQFPQPAENAPILNLTHLEAPATHPRLAHQEHD